MQANDICYINSVNSTFTVQPIDCTELFPYSFQILNGQILSKNITSFKLGKDLLIELKPLVYYSPLNLNISNINYNSQDIKLSFYNQTNSLIQINYNHNLINKCFFNPITVEHFTHQIASKEILFIKLKAQYKEYYLIFDKDKLLFEGYLKEINIDKTQLILLKDNISCLSIKQVINFNLETTSKEEYLIYYNKMQVDKELDIKYLFLDNCLVNNFEQAQNYLDNELKCIQPEVLKQFLGEFDNYYIIKEFCLLEKNGELQKVLQFSINNNLITNIDEP